VFTNLLLADEINRTPPKTQAALLEAMEERQVSVEGTPRPLPELSIELDDAGYLRATAGYDQAVGPGFWERTTIQ